MLSFDLYCLFLERCIQSTGIIITSHSNLLLNETDLYPAAPECADVMQRNAT